MLLAFSAVLGCSATATIVMGRRALRLWLRQLAGARCTLDSVSLLDCPYSGYELEKREERGMASLTA